MIILKRLSRVMSAKNIETNSKRRDEVRSKVYRALSDIMFDTQATKEDMDYALGWFDTHFYDSDDYED